MLAMNRGRERFIELLGSWERSKTKRIERAEKDKERDLLNAEDLKKYLPDSQNEISGDMTAPRGDDESEYGSIYFQEATDGKFPLKNKIFRMELKKLIPLKEWEITIRVDELLKAQRSVDVILTKNANKHSQEFMDGMNLVQGIETDLKRAHEMVVHTKNVYDDLKQKVAVTSMDIMKMSRKKKRLEMCRNILIKVYKRYHKYDTDINAFLDRGEYFDALNMIDKALVELANLPKEANMQAIKDIKRKFKNKRELIAQKTSQGIGDTIVSFDPILYSKCLQTLLVKVDEVTDFMMAGKKKNDKIQRLFEVSLYLVYEFLYRTYAKSLKIRLSTR